VRRRPVRDASRVVLLRAEDLHVDVRLGDGLAAVGVGHLRGGVDVDDLAVVHLDLVHHRRRRHDEVEAVLALEPLLHNLHVQQAEEAAAEAEAHRARRLGLEGERGVVERELLEGLAEQLVLGRLDGEEAAVHHRHL